MGILDKIIDFESQPLSQIIFNMIKWFEFDGVNAETWARNNVESGVWISLHIRKGEKTWCVDGQRLDIVKRRLIEFLDKQKVRPDPENKPEE